MMIGAIAIIVIMVAVVGSAGSAFTSPKRVILSEYPQPELVKQQTTQQHQVEFEYQQTAQQQEAEREKRQAELERQQTFLERRAAQRRQTEFVKQQTTQQQHPDLGKQEAAQKQQADRKKQQADLEKRQAEFERRQFLLEKRAAQMLKFKLKKQQAELEKQLAELEKKKTELKEKEATFVSPNPITASSLSCDAARQIIANLGFDDVRAELCTGDTYNFVARRSGRSFSIQIAAANGEVKNVPAEALVVVANQVRLQGYKCNKPSVVQPDVFLSKPGLAVWLLTCGEGRYRVELIPHKQARVTQLN
jgi:hypothetical protein